MKTREQTRRLQARRLRKRRHVRRKLAASPYPRPRLTVFRSSKNLYAQIIDDEQGITLCSASTRDKGIREELGGMTKSEQAKKVGSALAARAKDKGVGKVRFDRAHYKFHGRIKALADAAREGGLEF
ncbi:MAG: 50S ribosomal protein L18 [Planctomycetota bacterium]|nr:MAG: 50S ribosomal protein L18 [Planctomycetota bacterium]